MTLMGSGALTSIASCARLVRTMLIGVAPFALAGGASGADPNSSVSPTSPISIEKGDLYFTVDGKQTFLLGRNPTGWMPEHFEELFAWSAESGDSIVRIHFTTGRKPKAKAGEIDEEWARFWDSVIDLATTHGLQVLPVIGVWADWNDGSRNETWHSWHKNAYNAVNGGPAATPDELFHDTECRRLYLEWLGRLVARWQSRENIFAWEVFSELNLVTGATEDGGVEFVERAAEVIHAADTRRRPVTASLAGVMEWPKLWRSDAVDFIQIHPYAERSKFKGRLDELILVTVRVRLRDYGKPVFIGESGLDARGLKMPLNLDERASAGIRHAIWAAVVSGAMNGRMLWWEDGYDRYGGLELRVTNKHASAPVARFVEGIDFSGFRPVEVVASDELKGAAIGNNRTILAWFRDARCEPPEWPTRMLSDQSIVFKAPGDQSVWTATLHDGVTGDMIETLSATRADDALRLHLPAFTDSVAIKLAPTAGDN